MKQEEEKYTFEKIWQALAELVVSQKETEKLIKENAAATDRQIK